MPGPRMLSLRLSADRAQLVRVGLINTWRQIITGTNSRVKPGKFRNLQMHQGHPRTTIQLVKSLPTVGGIRIPCLMPSGLRVVDVDSRVVGGSLGWIRTANTGPGASRAASQFTIEVHTVLPYRLIDASPQNLEEMSFASIEAYRAYWQGIHGSKIWAVNPWCWAYSFKVIEMNIDEVRRNRT